LVLHEAAGRPWVWLLDIGLVLPLIWRRRAPVVVFIGLCGAALLQWTAGLRLGADIALLVSLYAIAAYRPRRLAVAAAAVLAQGASAPVPAAPAAAQAAMGQGATAGRDPLAVMRRLLGVLRADEPGALPDGAADRAPAPGLDRIDELIGSARSAGLPVRLTL